jgi:hypothetical protein
MKKIRKTDHLKHLGDILVDFRNNSVIEIKNKKLNAHCRKINSDDVNFKYVHMR